MKKWSILVSLEIQNQKNLLNHKLKTVQERIRSHWKILNLLVSIRKQGKVSMIWHKDLLTILEIELMFVGVSWLTTEKSTILITNRSIATIIKVTTNSTTIIITIQLIKASNTDKTTITIKIRAWLIKEEVITTTKVSMYASSHLSKTPKNRTTTGNLTWWAILDQTPLFPNRFQVPKKCYQMPKIKIKGAVTILVNWRLILLHSCPVLDLAPKHLLKMLNLLWLRSPLTSSHLTKTTNTTLVGFLVWTRTTTITIQIVKWVNMASLTNSILGCRIPLSSSTPNLRAAKDTKTTRGTNTRIETRHNTMEVGAISMEEAIKAVMGDSSSTNITVDSTKTIKCRWCSQCLSNSQFTTSSISKTITISMCKMLKSINLQVTHDAEKDCPLIKACYSNINTVKSWKQQKQKIRNQTCVQTTMQLVLLACLDISVYLLQFCFGQSVVAH